MMMIMAVMVMGNKLTNSVVSAFCVQLGFTRAAEK